MEDNISRIISIAQGLKELNSRVVYVGGAVVQFYADDAAAIEPRATVDVDCVVKYDSFKDKVSFENRLRELKFYEDREDGVICRWNHNNEKIDIIPSDERFLSFTNRWYEYGVETQQKYRINDEYVINIMPVLVYLATKLEAVESRGGSDLRCSHDFEDFIYVLNSCSTLFDQYEEEKNSDLKNFIRSEANHLISRKYIREEIECVLPYGEEQRLEYVMSLLCRLAENIL